MANNHDQFYEFSKTITLSDTRKKELNGSKKALRKTIRDFISKEKPDEVQPSFYTQGSFAMNTAVNPIKKDDKLPYDLDDGIYFIDEEKNRKSVETYHDWIANAVEGHTKESVKDKNTCVRVTFADGHHIDLPIYFKNKANNSSIPQLAHKKNGWVDSDPRAFVQWYKSKENAQITRLIKYSKAWLDHKSSVGKLPSGFILTILIIKNYITNDRDDISFLKTMTQISNSLKLSFVCNRPTPNISENLLSKYTESKDKFLNILGELISDGEKAINSEVQKSGCEKWQKHFGNRFSCANAKDELENAKEYREPATINASAKSA